MNWKITIIFLSLFRYIDIYSQVTHDMQCFIKELEGFSTSVYKDGPHLAVGYGHHLRFSPLPWLKNLQQGDTLSVQTCEILFEWDMNTLVFPGLIKVYKEIGLSYPSNVYDVMGSLIYNLGLNGLRNSRFYQLFCIGRYEESFTELLLLKSRSRGLWNRRQLELRRLLQHYNFSLNKYDQIMEPTSSTISVR